MKLNWLNQPYLDNIDLEKRKNFYTQLVQTQADKILICGNIAEAHVAGEMLKEMAYYV